MAGGDYICGTGPGNWPLPGDPNLSGSALTATRVFNGIQLRWVFPTLNPEAVAHTKVFRNTTNNFGTAVLHTIATGSSYLDPKIPDQPATQYWYWIQIVSVHGTVGDTIGPATAWMADNVADIIAMLEGEIGASMLNIYLKERIDTITDISSGLTVEQTERLLGETALTDLWASVQTELEAIDTLIINETLERTTADSAQAASIDFMLAKFNDNAAAIATEQSVRADADSANAALINTIQVEVDGLVTSVQELAIADSEFGAMYGVKLDVHGFVSGFGLYNSGSSSLFLVNANQFAIGTPDPINPGGAPDITDLPFIVDDGHVYMKSAMIADGTITTAKIENVIKSDDYVFDTQGWALYKDFFGTGSYAEFNNVKVRGNIVASSMDVGALNVISTLMVQGNAITVPAANVGTVVLNSTPGTWVEAVVSPGIAVGAGQPVQVQVSCEFVKSGGSGQSLVRYRLKRNSTIIYTCYSAQGSRVYADESEIVAFNFQDVPGAGASKAYSLEVTRGDSGGATITARNASITVTALKR